MYVEVLSARIRDSNCHISLIAECLSKISSFYRPDAIFCRKQCFVYLQFNLYILIVHRSKEAVINEEYEPSTDCIYSPLFTCSREKWYSLITKRQ